jgi:hypothetical protein
MLCPSCSAEIKDGAKVCPVCHQELTAVQLEIGSSAPVVRTDAFEPSSWLEFVSHYMLLPILLLIVAHYILFFLFQLNILSVYMTLIYCTIAFPFGYDLCSRTRNHVAVACAVGLVVGVAAVTGMSAVVFLLLDQGFFPDKRQVQDFIETLMAIMLAYAAGSATANFVHQLLPDTAGYKSFADSIRAIIALAHGGPGVTERLLSLEAAIKALVAVVLAVGTLLVAVRKLIF